MINPKPMSSVATTRNNVKKLDCDEKLFKQVVKLGFNSRRKTLRNGLKTFGMPKEVTSSSEYFDKRAEQLTVQDFVNLTNIVSDAIRN